MRPNCEPGTLKFFASSVCRNMMVSPITLVATTMRGRRRHRSRSSRSHRRRASTAHNSAAPTQPEIAIAAATPTCP